MDLKFTDSAEISGSVQTKDGYLVGDVRCARTGIQQYHASELGLAGNGIINVYRPASEVFNADSLASYAHKPISDNHPPAEITADNWKQYAGGDIGDQVTRDGDFVRVPYKLMDAALINQVRAGKHEVSMGYTAELDFTDGVAENGEKYQAIQRKIRVNHLAIVDRGRAGKDCRISDSAVESWGSTPIRDTATNLKTDEKENNVTIMTLLIDGRSVETTEAGAAEIRAIMDSKTELTKQMNDAAAEHANELKAKDTELATRDAEIEKLKAEKMTDAELDARVQERSDLLSKARSIAKDADFSGLTASEIKRKAVEATLDAALLEGKSESYIDARFDIICDNAANGDTGNKSRDPFADSLRSGPENKSADNGQAGYVTRMLNAHKTNKGAQ